MNNTQKNIFGKIFLLALLLFLFYEFLTSEILPRYYHNFAQTSLYVILSGIIYLLMWAGLAVILIFYARRANQIRNLIWQKGAVYTKNIYLTPILLFGPLLVVVMCIWMSIVPKEFHQMIPKSLGLVGIMMFLLCTMVLLPASMWLYNTEYDRITQALFVKLARELGCDKEVLDSLRFPQRGWPGLWAQVSLNYKGQEIIFAAEDTRIPRFTCFLIGIERPDKPKCVQNKIIGQMNEETKMLFQEIRKQIKNAYISCQQHKLFFRIPISKISKINVELLKRTIDILLQIP